MREFFEGKWATLPSRRSTWKQCGNCGLDQGESLKSGSWNGTLVGENSRYVFELVRASETKPWAIQAVTKKTDESLQIFKDGRKKDAGGLLIFKPFVFGMPEMFRMSAFEAVDVVSAPQDGQELVRITFRYSPEDRENDRLRGGILVLDPSRDWVIRRAELDLEAIGETTGPWKYIHEYQYKDGPNGHPLLTRTELRNSQWDRGAISYEFYSVGETNMHERKVIPESEFTLSAYGLPEPDWAPPKRTLWYLWLGLAGILCLMAGAGLAWLKKWRSSHVA
jgi:hypothetical protein